MSNSYHSFHIPVMGTGHSVDTPIRVAPFGIDSVISIVDDLLLERIRKYYASEFNLPFSQIPRNAPDGRAHRITAYLNTVHEIVSSKVEALKSATFSESEEKNKFFSMLPTENPLRSMWEKMTSITDHFERSALEEKLTSFIKPGSIDVNIMAKVDLLGVDKQQRPLSAEFSDANAALRGFAQSVLESSVILSAGFNPRLYNYLAEFPAFYRDVTGELKKKIVLKVSDFRSALIQGKYLAKKGLEVSEFRIESGLNCGGHAFYSDGRLLPDLLEEFKNKKDTLTEQFQPLVKSFYEQMGWDYPTEAEGVAPKITVQGGIGTHGEALRLLEEYDVDGTGWGSPFLLVPEATCVDDPTIQLLKDAKEEDLYLSPVSPLGVPFNNIRNSGSEKWRNARKESLKPGSPCPKGYLKSNTEFTELPICTASTQYQLLKISEIEVSDRTESEKFEAKEAVLDKSCLCDHLGNGSLINLGIIKEKQGPQAICPGPNIAWFDRTYSLKEMTDHIYGRTHLVPRDRPHMFAKELVMNVDYLEEVAEKSDLSDRKAVKYLKSIRSNLKIALESCKQVAKESNYRMENLESLAEIIPAQEARIEAVWNRVFPEPVIVKEPTFAPA